MSDDDRKRWDDRYAEGSYSARQHPCPLLAEWGERLAEEHGTGPALDLACGRGRNAIHLARLGFVVDAIDISPVGVDQAREAAAQTDVSIHWQVGDLDSLSLPEAQYRVILVSRYRYRYLSGLARALAAGGTLLYEQHLTLPESAMANVGGPRSTRFRFSPNELLKAVLPALWIRHYEEGVFPDPDGAPMALARLVANKPS